MPSPAPIIERTRPAAAGRAGPVAAPASTVARLGRAAPARLDPPALRPTAPVAPVLATPSNLTPPVGAAPASLPAAVRRAITGAGAGSSLLPQVAIAIERGLGIDTTDVRVHTSEQAATAAAQLGVRAFTWGRDVFLGVAESPADIPLLAHEVTHAVQQSAGAGPVVHLFDGPHGALESEAHSVATTVASGGSAVVRGRAGGSRVQGLFGIDVKERVLGFIRDKAAKMPGYDLLGFAIGRDPVSQRPVERTPVALVRAVLGLVPGGNAIFDNLMQAKVIQRAYAWLVEQVAMLGFTWNYIRGLFTAAWDALSARDLLSPSSAWEKLKGTFDPPLRRLLDFVLAAGRKVLEFVFEGAMALAGTAGQQVLSIFRRAQAVLGLVVADPLRFMGNLLGAVKGGVGRFKDHILTHLKTGLFDWLMGAMEGITLPKKWDFAGILSLILQVLGLTYQALRAILVRLIGEPAVLVVEKAMAFLVTVATKGLSAAWEKIKEFASDLADTVISAIRDWVVQSIVGAAVTKLVTMFNPVGAIIQGIITIYNTVMFFIERAKQIARLVNAVLDSVENIARGNLSAAIAYVEKAMASTIPVILGFLGRFAGLGAVTGHVKNIVMKIRATISGALEKVGQWIKEKVKGVLAGRKTQTADGKPGPAHPAGPDEAIREPLLIGGEKHEVSTMPGSYALQMASGKPVPLDQKQVEGLAAAYKAYSEEVNKAATPTERKRVAKAKVKQIVRLLVSKSNPEHPAPGIGDIGPHKNQVSKLRDLGMPLWLMRSEHVIPRFFVDALLTLGGQAKTTFAQYAQMTTVLIYKGAEEFKDERTPEMPTGGDFSLIAKLRDALERREAADATKDPIVKSGSHGKILYRLVESREAFKRAFRLLASGAIHRTVKAVRLDNERNGKARGLPGKPEPMTPSEANVKKAAALQLADINRIVDGMNLRRGSIAALGRSR